MPLLTTSPALNFGAVHDIVVPFAGKTFYIALNL